MATAVQAPPNPTLFFETTNMYERTAALKAAVELDLFTAIGDRSASVAEIARGCNASERGTEILCNYLTTHGFLQKTGDAYRLTTDTAAFLDRRSPAYLGGTLQFLLGPQLRDAMWNLADAVRRGGCVDGEGAMAPEHPVWQQFARSMMPLMAMPARAIADNVNLDPGRKLRILDIAAGHGIFGITLAQKYPRAEVVAVDWPDVLQVAQENAERFGVAERYALIPGSAFDVDLGTNYDLILLTNFLHHFDEPTNVGLLRRVHSALADGGQALTLEFVPSDDRVTPPAPASFSLKMLAMTPSGRAYTFRELESMFRAAGFSRSEERALPPGIESLVISYW